MNENTDESVANSSEQENENETKSTQPEIESVIKKSRDLSQAIDLAKQIYEAIN